MHESIALISRFLDAENARNWEEWAKYLDAEIEYEVIGASRIVRGKDEYVAHMKTVYSELPDWQFKAVNIVGSATRVMVEFDGSGHFTGTHAGRKYRNVPLRLNAICVFEVDSGMISRIREYFDQRGYESQLRAAGAQA